MSILKNISEPINTQFLQQVNHRRSKKGSSTSITSYPTQKQHHPTSNPIVNYTHEQQQKLNDIEQELESIVKPFQKNLQKLLQNIQEDTKYYYILSLLRKNDLLSDFSQGINEKMIKQNFRLKKQLHKLEQTVVYLSKSQRENSSKRGTSQSFHQGQKKQGKVDPSKSISQNIYLHAKSLKQGQFIDWCDKILMKNKIVITEIKRQMTPTKMSISKNSPLIYLHKRTSSEFYQRQARKENPDLYEKYSELIRKIQGFSPFLGAALFEDLKIQLIQDVEALKIEKFSCKRFCCNLEKQNIEAGSSRGFWIRSDEKGHKIKSEKDIYRDNKTQQYFKRYYKHPDFKVDSIVSVEQTKGEEMVRIQNQYHRMLEQRNKLRSGH